MSMLYKEVDDFEAFAYHQKQFKKIKKIGLRSMAFWYNLSIGKILQKKKHGKLHQHLP